MSSTLKPEGFGLKIYDRYPEMFRSDDKDTKYSLRRFLNTCGEGGFKYIIEGANRLLNHYDPDKVDISILPYLFKSYGFEIFHGIPEVYIRKLLPTLSLLFKRKGTIEVVEYLASLVSGVKSNIDILYPRSGAKFDTAVFGDPASARFGDIGYSDHGVVVNLEMDFNTGDRDLPDEDQVKRIIREFVPFYCIVTVVFQFIYTDLLNIRIRDNYFLDYIFENKEEIHEHNVKDDYQYNYINDKYAVSAGLDNDIDLMSDLLRQNDRREVVHLDADADADAISLLEGDNFYGDLYIDDEILDAQIVNEEDFIYATRTSVFGHVLFGVSVFGSGMTDYGSEDIVNESHLEVDRMSIPENLKDSIELNLVNENCSLSFTDDTESVKIDTGMETPQYIQEGAVPKYSGLFGYGLMSASIFGANIPYQETDKVTDVIINV